jgi:hypothetical protein
MEGSVDHWVEKIAKQYPKKQGKWIRIPKPKDENIQEDGKSVASGGSTRSGVDVSKYNIDEVKQKLRDSGMDEDMMKILSNSDMIETAITLGLFDETKDKPEE